MKPCVCNGSNDNCHYCSGSGYVPDENPMPKGIPMNPYIGMKPPTPPPRNPEIENEILRSSLARQAERDRLEERRHGKRKSALVIVVLLLIVLLFAFGRHLLNLVIDASSRGVTAGMVGLCSIVLILAIEGWRQRRKRGATRR